MSFSRNLKLPLLALFALAASACEIVADFDRDRISEANAKPPSDIPMIPAVPPEMPDDTLDAGDDAGGDASIPGDAGDVMDSGASDDAGQDPDLEDDASVDASTDDAATDDAGSDDAGEDSGT